MTVRAQRLRDGGRPILKELRGFSVHRDRHGRARTAIAWMAAQPASSSSVGAALRRYVTYRAARPLGVRPYVTYGRSLPIRDRSSDARVSAADARS
jgi:hypothetical protein